MAINYWQSSSSTDWNVAGNWSDGVPNAGDTLVFAANAVPVLSNLDQSAVALGDVFIEASYTGWFGGSSSEYLKIDPNNLWIGVNHNYAGSRLAGSPRLNIDLGSTGACNVIVESTCTRSTDLGFMPVRVKSTHASSTLRVNRGFVGVAETQLEAATFATIWVGCTGATEQDTHLHVGRGTGTLTTVNVSCGRADIGSAFTTGNVYGGKLMTFGAGAVTTINQYSGTTISNSIGTVTTINQYGGHLDLDQTSEARTITTYNPFSGSVQISPAVTITNNNSFNKRGRVVFGVGT